MSEVIAKQRSVAINPTRSCQPIGAMYVTLGIHGAIPLCHGSQGCATYPRHQMARHFREPIEVASTSLTEKTTIYGGGENLIQALKNLITRYNPEMIVVMTTCLSETIGDDVLGIIADFMDENPEVDIPLIPVNTPGYVGTHINGYDNAISKILSILPKKSNPNGKLNVIPGWVNPGDVRELKYILEKMGIETIFLTDFSNTFDGPLRLPKPRFPAGGTKVEEIIDSANSVGTIALCRHIGGEAAEILEKRFGIPARIGSMPIGIRNTDRFLEAISELTGKEIPEEISCDRGRLLDAIVDVHMFLTGKKVAIYGDPDLVAGMARFVTEMGMEPAYTLTASESKDFVTEVQKIAEETETNPEILAGHDLYELHQRIKKNPVDLLIGHSKGKFISEDEAIPLVRVGFPIEDRYGYQRRAIVGYNGGIYLVDKITNTILENGKKSRKEVISGTLLEKESEENAGSR